MHNRNINFAAQQQRSLQIATTNRLLQIFSLLPSTPHYCQSLPSIPKNERGFTCLYKREESIGIFNCIGFTKVWNVLHVILDAVLWIGVLVLGDGIQYRCWLIMKWTHLRHIILGRNDWSAWAIVWSSADEWLFSVLTLVAREICRLRERESAMKNQVGMVKGREGCTWHEDRTIITTFGTFTCSGLQRLIGIAQRTISDYIPTSYGQSCGTLLSSNNF